MSRRRDAVPDDARSRPRSPNASGRLSTPRRWALGNRSGPGMMLAATAPTTNESESLATDISGIVDPSQALDPEDERDGHPLVGKWPATARLQTVAAAGHLPTSYQRKLSSHLAPGRTTDPQSRRKLRCGATPLGQNPPLDERPITKGRRPRRAAVRSRRLRVRACHSCRALRSGCAGGRSRPMPLRRGNGVSCPGYVQPLIRAAQRS